MWFGIQMLLNEVFRIKTFFRMIPLPPLLCDLKILHILGCGGEMLTASFDFYICLSLFFFFFVLAPGTVNRKSSGNLLSSV